MSSIFTADDIDKFDDTNQDVDGDIDMQEPSNTGDKPVTGTTKHDAEDEDDEEDEPSISHKIPAIPEFTRADKTLDELMDLLDDPDFTPIIPDAVTDYYLNKSGLSLDSSDTESLKIKRLLALATQKFISDIATDAYEHSRIRCNSAVYTANNPQTRSRQLLMATMAKAKGGNNASSDMNEEADENTNANTNLNSSVGQSKEKVTLTINDLSNALEEYGLNINRPQFYR